MLSGMAMKAGQPLQLKMKNTSQTQPNALEISWLVACRISLTSKRVEMNDMVHVGNPLQLKMAMLMMNSKEPSSKAANQSKYSAD